MYNYSLYVTVAVTIVNIIKAMCTLLTDVDECLEGSSDCEQICTNTMGNYHCSCYPGYVIGQDDANTCTLGESVDIEFYTFVSVAIFEGL